MLPVKADSEVVGNLPARGNDDAVWMFEVQDVHNTFEGEFVKVKAITHVVVGGDGFRVVINHDGTETFFANGVEGLDTAPVEFYGATDTVGSGTKDDDRAAVTCIPDIIFGTIISEVEVISLCGIFGGESIYLLDDGDDILLLTMATDLKDSHVHIFMDMLEDGTGDLKIGKSLSFGTEEEFFGQHFETITLFQFCGSVDDAV